MTRTLGRTKKDEPEGFPEWRYAIRGAKGWQQGPQVLPVEIGRYFAKAITTYVKMNINAACRAKLR